MAVACDHRENTSFMKAITITIASGKLVQIQGIEVIPNSKGTFRFFVGRIKANCNKRNEPNFRIQEEQTFVDDIQFVDRDNQDAGFLVVRPLKPQQGGMAVLLRYCKLLEDERSNYKIRLHDDEDYLIILHRDHYLRFQVDDEIWTMQNYNLQKEN